MNKNPMQPFVMDGKVVRFKANKIVAYLLDSSRDGHKVDLNDLAMMEFSQDDRAQFAQLIGYSLCGFHELSYVSDLAAENATQAARIQFKRSKIGGCRDDGCEIHAGVTEEVSA